MEMILSAVLLLTDELKPEGLLGLGPGSGARWGLTQEGVLLFQLFSSLSLSVSLSSLLSVSCLSVSPLFSLSLLSSLPSFLIAPGPSSTPFLT